MKEHHRGKSHFLVALGLIILLIITGCMMVVRVFDRYEEVVLQNEDQQLLGLARSVDRSVTSYLSHHASSLRYLTARRGFLAAERVWLTTGDSSQLLSRMRETMVAGDPLTPIALVLMDGQVALSTNGRTDYRFPPQAGRKRGEVTIRPCLDGDNTLYLCFLLEEEQGPSYAVLMDLGQFYARVAGTISAGTLDHITLLDAGGQTLLHMVDGQVVVELTSQLSSTALGCDYGGVSFLMECQSTQTQGFSFYEAHPCQGGASYTARMAVFPATDENNGFFAVGVSMNYDEIIRPLKTGGVRLLAYGGMVVTGVLLLLWLMLRVSRRHERIQRELAALQEKSAAAEELTRRTRELAHHQRLETIGTLTSSIAHEFNNLLTPIMGYSLMALERLPPEEEELYDDLLEIYNASREAKTIISRLSDLSRKNTALTFQYVSPDELARKVLAVAAPARPGNVTVSTRLNCPLLWMFGNETQLSQLLLNLVLNAFHAMEPGGGTLTLSTWSEGDFVFLRVEDTGPGIPEDVLPHIFEPFFTTKESGRGTGLGLPIVQQVAEEHQGSLQVDTQVGRGTSMTVRFPLTPKEE